VTKLAPPAKRMEKINAAIDSVLAGRNVLKGATDQGMVGLDLHRREDRKALGLAVPPTLLSVSR
jgi:hypothetical protein